VKNLNQTPVNTHGAGIKALLDEEGGVIRSAHFAGANGSEVVQRRTSLIDRMLRLAHGRLPPSAMPALIAIGGYGRGELNPHSDIDIMFLCSGDADRQCSTELLYMLWDAGMDLSYSVRTVKECVSLARQDSKIRTSLLESRLIAGEPALYHSFLNAMESDVFHWRAASYINEKIAERVATRLKYGGSIYLREPNIKEGTGGLRDFHTAFWIAFAHYRITSLADLVREGILTAGQYAVFVRSRNFLWRVRNELHYLSGRKNDHLTFDLQERTARDFHYRDSTHLLAVERFMKSYFLHARNVREFSSIVSEAVLRKPRTRWFERKLSLGPFSLVGRTLMPSSDGTCHDDPSLIMTAFELAQTRHATFSNRLRSLISSCRIDDRVRTSAAASHAFLAILNNPDHLSETLTLMKDLRFLGRYLPEFRAIQALARHDYYHKYTVDEHILLAIRNLQNLWSGNYPALSTLSEAFNGLKKRWVLILTVLLHDLGKAYRSGHELRGAEIAETILARMAVGGEDRARILFLIRNHLIMSSLSQRRELTDQKVIADFARVVVDQENLSLLYLLTYADISAVNPTAWTQWKAVLLQDLYLRTVKFLERGSFAGEDESGRLSAVASRIKTAASELFTPQDVDAFLAVMPDQYLLYTPVSRVLDHMGMMRRLPGENLIIQYRHYPEKGFTELTLCAYDAYGMFFRTAGTIASKNLSILRAQVYTTKSGVMIDTFQVTDPDGTICTYDDAWESVVRALRAALMRESRPPEPGVYLPVSAAPVAVTPIVEFDNDSSETFSIIDITTRDMVGLLYRVTKALYDLNLDIASAKIVTEGVRVMDSFYVTDLLRRKVTDDVRLNRIKEELLKVLE
jgi:[protein-PII] uridylyltransferase